MIFRYIVIGFIGILFTLAILLGKANLKLLTFNRTSEKVKAASSIKANPVPTPSANFNGAPTLTARSAVVIDAKTGFSLFEKNPDLKHLPASTTKLMTALVALEKCSKETVIAVNDVEKEGTQMGLEIGDQITVENLLFGLLINSGNDAAQSLASDCADSLNQFVDSMNRKAKDLKMDNTRFTNPTGFDDSYQYSTASDLAKLASVAMANPLISEIVATKSTVVTDITGTRTYYLENINELLDVVDGIEGIKTGQTEGALENLITKTTRNNNSIIVITLGSDDRFRESQNLIEWAFKNFNWVNSY